MLQEGPQHDDVLAEGRDQAVAHDRPDVRLGVDAAVRPLMAERIGSAALQLDHPNRIRVLLTLGLVPGHDLLGRGRVEREREIARIARVLAQPVGEQEGAHESERAAATDDRIGVDQRVADRRDAERDGLARLDEEAAGAAQARERVHVRDRQRDAGIDPVSDRGQRLASRR